jgi:fumarylpyruvate hydrolase
MTVAEAASRRRALRGVLAAGTGLAAAGAVTGAAAEAARTPFEVAPVRIPVADSELQFPVRRIYCIGRNYAAHAREMGSDPSREPPFFFQKPTDAVQFIPPQRIVEHPYPTLTRNYHHEVELVVAIGRDGRDIDPGDALAHVWGYALGLDMTRRDLQRGMGDQKKPWEIGKSFDRSAPIGPVHPVSSIGHLNAGEIRLAVNGEVRQRADLSEMIWSVAEQISRLSEAFELCAGDLIYTGTPENVGPVVRGDTLAAHIDRLAPLSIRIT